MSALQSKGGYDDGSSGHHQLLGDGVIQLMDTYFVSLLNDSVQNAAVTLAAPVLLSFNAVNNLFGVGSSSLMSRALGKKDYEAVRRTSALGFYCTLACGVLVSAGYLAFRTPLITLLGADSGTPPVTRTCLNWTTACGAVPAILNVVLAYLVRSEGASLHASMGTMSGCLLNILLNPVFILPWGLKLGASVAGKHCFCPASQDYAGDTGSVPAGQAVVHYGLAYAQFTAERALFCAAVYMLIKLFR